MYNWTKFRPLETRPNDIKPNQIVLEASHTIDIEGQSMELALCTDKIIEGNGLQEVTDPIPFKNGREPTDGGLFSPLIFGETPKERVKTHAYINLKRKFFHPYVYEILSKLYSKFDTIASGQGAWYINATGDLEEIKDPQDRRYNEENTGLAWLVKNFKKIHFKESDSDKRKAMLALIHSLSDDEIFISKWIVIPVFYRDVDNSTGKITIDQLNEWYSQILMNVNSYDTEVLSISKHLTLYKIQKLMVEIRKYGQSLIEKKKGALQRTILGKAPDFGGRGVISVPSMDGCDCPEDCLVDITHSGIPLAKCIEMGYPFMIKWIMEFFEETFLNQKSTPCYKKVNGKMELTRIDISDQSEIFTQKYIDKKAEMFKETYGAERFEAVKIRGKDGKEYDMYFPGKGYTNDTENARSNTIGTRPMTWTDIFYLAAVETLSDKHVFITRYPLEDYFGTFPSKVAVLSTIRTSPVIINGKVYRHYPVIDLNLPYSVVARQFIDTFSFSNLYLDAIGGDYDGDTVSGKILFTLEANQESDAHLKSIRHYLTVQGKLNRVLGNETFLTFYNMTRRE